MQGRGWFGLPPLCIYSPLSRECCEPGALSYQPRKTPTTSQRVGGSSSPLQGEETEAQRGEATRQGSHSRRVWISIPAKTTWQLRACALTLTVQLDGLSF